MRRQQLDVLVDDVQSFGAQVKAISARKGVTLISMVTPGMWHEVGFLARAFAVFERHDLSIDLIATSETNVTVSIDRLEESLPELKQFILPGGDPLAELSRCIPELAPVVSARLPPREATPRPERCGRSIRPESQVAARVRDGSQSAGLACSGRVSRQRPT